MSKLMNITEICRKLNLIDPKTKKPKNHILRYWEKEFVQLKPKKINSRRYYTSKDVDIIEKIKFYLREQKISIAGVKKILKNNVKKLDDKERLSYLNKYNKIKFKNKSKELLNKIKDLKKYGQKNSS